MLLHLFLLIWDEVLIVFYGLLYIGGLLKIVAQVRMDFKQA